MSNELIERLRAWDAGFDGSVDICYEAADILESQAREIEVLKEQRDPMFGKYRRHVDQLQEEITELRAALVECQEVLEHVDGYWEIADAPPYVFDARKALTRCKEVLK